MNEYTGFTSNATVFQAEQASLPVLNPDTGSVITTPLIALVSNAFTIVSEPFKMDGW